MLEGTYFIARKVKDLPNGCEYQPNRFITRPEDATDGAYVTYRSQEGDLRYLLKDMSHPLWLEGNDSIDCQVDFVPDSRRDAWNQLRKLGNCFMGYDAPYDMWCVYYPLSERPELSIGHTVESMGAATQAGAIDNAMWDFHFTQIVHNGYRWFDCRDIINFKKISDQEAEKILNGNSN